MLSSRFHGIGSRTPTTATVLHPVLLHGFLGAGRNLSSLARLLTRAHPELGIHLPDLPGHGSSPTSTRGAGFDAMATEVLEFLETLPGPGPHLLAGHSFGARVALACLEKAPIQIAKVAILDMTPGPLVSPVADRMVEDLLAAPAKFESRASAAAFFRARAHDPAIVAWLSMNLKREPNGTVGWQIDRPYLAAVHAATRDRDLWPVVEAYADRLYFMRGERSSIVPASDLERLEALEIPVTTIVGSGHFLHVDALDATAAAVQAWAISAW